MIEFLRKLFGQPVSSSATAKDRLRLVLMTDHLELAPDMIESMKRDLVDVISRFVEVDREKIEVHFEQQDKALAMLANIPILSVNRDPDGDAASPSKVADVSSQDEAAPAAPPVKRRRRRRRKAKTGEPAIAVASQ